MLDKLRPLGSDSYTPVIFKHGVREPCYGVRIGDMQTIVRRIKRDHQLALDLYATGVYDAMYLARLIADDMRMRAPTWAAGSRRPTAEGGPRRPSRGWRRAA